MKKVSKVVVFIIVLTLVALFVGGCASKSENENNQPSEQVSESNQKQYTIKITHVLSDKHHYTKGAKKFKEIIEEKSNGRIKVEIYPNAQLGGERTVLEGLQMGTIEMGIITSGALSGFVPEFAVLDLGYLFRDNDEAMKVLNGPVGQELSQKMVDIGIRNLGFINYAFRSVYGKKPIQTIDDLKGVKIRTMENPAHQALFKALGASPVPMAWPELYTGLQQGTIDAAENSPDVLYASKHYEVAKHYSLTEHVFNVVMYMISEKFYQTLPEDLQNMVADAAKQAIEYENGVIRNDINNALSELKKVGVEIYEIQNKEPFYEAAKQSWEEVIKDIPNGEEYLNKILKAEGRNK